MYASPDETLAALESVGYFTDQKTATTVYLAGKLHRPIMLEGPAGAGKTELATSVSRVIRHLYCDCSAIRGSTKKKPSGNTTRAFKNSMCS